MEVVAIQLGIGVAPGIAFAACLHLMYKAKVFDTPKKARRVTKKKPKGIWLKIEAVGSPE